MKNKYMVKEVQKVLPDSYDCLQCGIAKLFCAYSDTVTDSEWRDPEITGVAAIITQVNTYSTYIRVYEFDDVTIANPCSF